MNQSSNKFNPAANPGSKETEPSLRGRKQIEQAIGGSVSN
jgi:hypothetical protein